MVGKKIRAFREFRGYSQIQLAELSGINVGTIRKYELGMLVFFWILILKQSEMYSLCCFLLMIR